MIIVIGKNGQLAQACAKLFGKLAVPFVCLGRDDVDILDETALAKTLNNYSGVTAILNASAYTAVDKAEQEQEQAIAVNCTAVKFLSTYAKSVGAFFVHISTDYVFSGEGNTPYQPCVPYQPINVYGKSKMMGEQAVMDVYPHRSCVLRTSWVYSEYGNNFVKTMLRLFKERSEVNVVMDQVGSPTSAHTLAEACYRVILAKVTGIHHACDLGVTSWYDFAKEVYRQAQASNFNLPQVNITPIGSEAFPTPAARPHYSVLDTRSLRSSVSGLTLPHWQESLSNVIEQLNYSK